MSVSVCTLYVYVSVYMIYAYECVNVLMCAHVCVCVCEYGTIQLQLHTRVTPQACFTPMCYVFFSLIGV